MFSIRLEGVLKLCYQEQFNLIIRLENVLKTFSKHLEDVLKMSWGCLENVLKTSWRRMTKTNMLILMKTSWRRLEDVFWRRMSKANIFVLIKTSWIRLLKTMTKDVFIKTNVCWVEPFLPKMNHLVSRRQNRYLTVQFFVIILWKISIHLPVQSSFFKYHWF